MPLPCFTSPSVGLTQTSLAATGLFLKAQQTIINFCTLQSGSPPRTSWHWKNELVQSPRSKTCYQVLFYLTDMDYLRLYRDAIGGGEPAIILTVSKRVLILRTWSLIRTFLTFWVLIGSLFIFQGPYFHYFGFIHAKNVNSVCMYTTMVPV